MDNSSFVQVNQSWTYLFDPFCQKIKILPKVYIAQGSTSESLYLNVVDRLFLFEVALFELHNIRVVACI